MGNSTLAWKQSKRISDFTQGVVFRPLLFNMHLNDFSVVI